MLKTIKSSFLFLLLSAVFNISICFGQETETSTGELKIEGGYIEKLVLEDKNHQALTFENPDEIIKLPVGQYRLLQVYIIGGYSCGFRTSMSGSNLIKIEENKQAAIRAGAPLKQVIETARRGKFLILNYKLIGIDGQNYIRTNIDKKPEFSVYKGNKLIGSGKFQYG